MHRVVFILSTLGPGFKRCVFWHRHANASLQTVTKSVLKKVRVWPEGASAVLETTNWKMFKQAATYHDLTDIEEYSDTVTSYIRCNHHKNYHHLG